MIITFLKVALIIMYFNCTVLAIGKINNFLSYHFMSIKYNKNYLCLSYTKLFIGIIIYLISCIIVGISIFSTLRLLVNILLI